MEKFRANVERDRRKFAELAALGWSWLVVWECETTDRERLAALLERYLLSERTIHEGTHT